jgi:2OG-Fe(II) oxygenase superfamily
MPESDVCGATPVTTNATFRAPYLVVDDFMPPAMARAMRAAVETHFGDPYRHSTKTHMVWNYWHVPGLYTYLRTLPEMVIGSQLADAFHTSLFQWSRETLGLGGVNSSYLSLYVNGCRQNQHNDSQNGRFGFVYFLTKNSRKSSGGETLIWREEDYFETRMHRASAGRDFFHSVEPRFNRLLVFDDRLPHAVETIEGNMDPLEGRIVLHGHLVEVGPIVSGPLEPDRVRDIAEQLALEYSTDLGDALTAYHGPAVVRFTVKPDGTVSECGLLLDRVKRLGDAGPEVGEMLADLTGRISRLRFPAGSAESVVTLPFGFGDHLAKLR